MSEAASVARSRTSPGGVLGCGLLGVERSSCTTSWRTLIAFTVQLPARTGLVPATFEFDYREVAPIVAATF
jgi:hypothetical protein